MAFNFLVLTVPMWHQILVQDKNPLSVAALILLLNLISVCLEPARLATFLVCYTLYGLALLCCSYGSIKTEELCQINIKLNHSTDLTIVRVTSTRLSRLVIWYIDNRIQCYSPSMIISSVCQTHHYYYYLHCSTCLY